MCDTVVHDEATDIMIESDPIIQSGNLTQLRWSPESLLPGEPPDSYSVDISFRQYNNDSREWTVINIVTRVPNTGFIEVTIPEGIPQQNVDDSVGTGVIQISVSEELGGLFRKRAIFSRITREVLRTIGIYTRVVVSVFYPTTEVIRRAACELWGLTQSRERALEVLASLPPCPCTVAAINGGDFEEEGISSVIFHPGSDRCFRERKR